VPPEKEVNAYLTLNCYHFAVQAESMKRGRHRTGDKPGIWLAIAVAVALHGMFLLLPVAGEKPPARDRLIPIEIELATNETQAPEPAPDLRIPASEPVPGVLPRPAEIAPEKLAASKPAEASEPQPTAIVPYPVRERDFDKLSGVEKAVLTSTILARQYITEESAADRLFGKNLLQDSSDIRKEFHYPLRQDLIEMLNQPLPDIPFEYTPGLIYFAYDPGLKGDLQRFWDVITPEFGWRTKYGTEVKCALILIIPGCVWK